MTYTTPASPGPSLAAREIAAILQGELFVPVLENRSEHFFHAFARWAATRGDIVGVALVGSFARGTPASTSDIDLLVLTTAPTDYLAQTKWAHAFGVLQREQQEDWGAVRSLRVWYVDGREVEYGFTLPTWANVPPDDGTRAAASGGIRVLFDPLGVLEALCAEIEHTNRES